MKILLLSAYDAQSHQYWRKGIVAEFSEHQWTVLTLPARFFSWRVRGNSLTWALNESETLAQDFDLILATSMTDLTGLKGLVPRLAQVPAIVYFHENQFEYPLSGKEHSSVEPQMLSIYNALSADKVVFNSQFNQSTFMLGARKLLKKLPDQVPKNIAQLIENKSLVLPVPLKEVDWPTKCMDKERPLTITWNHRWEYDKGPELLFNLLECTEHAELNVMFNIVGQRFRHSPEVFDTIEKRFKSKLGQFGYLENIASYHQLLASSDVVLSTALHDFQGLSILEAVDAGAIPLLPNQLAYPELFEQKWLYDDEKGVDAIVDRLSYYAKAKSHEGLPKSPIVDAIKWKKLRASYAKLFNQYGSFTTK